MSTLAQKLKHELHELIPVTLFFFVAFQLLALTDALILKQYGIPVAVFMSATIGALVAAKVVVITDHFALLNQFPTKPLIYNVVWKTLIYFAGWLLIRYAEHLIHFWRETGSFAGANRRLLDEIIWPHFWGVQLWMLVLLLVFCAFRELVRAVGRERVVAMFFRPPHQPGPRD
ncbi:hypothetical protein OKA05_17985 [Luteolibacter arcticus]|uniref:Intracellular septation protein A n=1 Tax=Luteolibacter arcticus TaxID=1581411 RepID=A0ABT3GLU3_9BACT|nr:hypothetical protein [Luteolibacter arcticus]MCW1924462.1 hypothetical protein [Luteolibacter arcticus]